MLILKTASINLAANMKIDFSTTRKNINEFCQNYTYGLKINFYKSNISTKTKNSYNFGFGKKNEDNEEGLK